MTRNDYIKTAFGSTLWRDLKKEFVQEAKRAKTIEDTAHFCVKWSAYLFYDSPIATIKNRSLEMRKELEANGVNEKIVSAFLLHSNVYKALNVKYSDGVADTLAEDAKSELDYVSFVEDTISKLVGEIENGDHTLLSNNSRLDREVAYKQLIVLALATGRRQIELLKTVTISKKKDEAVYTGLAKKKTDDQATAEAPILIDISIAKKYLKNIREVFGTEPMSNKEINSKYNASIAKAVTRYVDENFDFSFFRSAYAEYCFLKFGGEIDKHTYFAKVLGHYLEVTQTMAYMANAKKGNRTDKEK